MAATAAPADSTAPRERTVEEYVLRVLAVRPATTREIARALECAREGLLTSREGHLLPLLLDLRRRGVVEGGWSDRPEGRRHVHRLHGAEPPRVNGFTSPPPSPPPGHAVRHAAERTTEALAFAPRLAEELRAETLHHLGDAAADHVAAGVPHDEAERLAVAAWGDTWRISTDLRRAARGRRTLPFPRGMWEGVRAVLVNDAPILGVILGTIAFLRIAVIGAYHIPTKSMEPSLHGDRRHGDRILVLKWSPPPSRFDIWVFDGWSHERKHFVKRCVGLPGEDVNLREGDLWINGSLVRKEGSAYEAMLFPLFDLGGEIERAARPDSEGLVERLRESWDARGGAGWKLHADGAFEGRVLRAAPEAATLSWGDRITDALYDTDTLDLLETGLKDVADLRVDAEVTPEDATARIALDLGREDRRFTAALVGELPGVALFVDGMEVERREDLSVRIGRTTRVRFAQVDHVLRLELDGKLVIRHELPQPEHPRRTDSPAGSVTFRIDAGAAKVRPLRLERDVHWTSDYEALDHGRLGPDEYFMLGDNSSNSEDSRRRGPVHGSRLVGKPVLIVWPPSRVRYPR